MSGDALLVDFVEWLIHPSGNERTRDFRPDADTRKLVCDLYYKVWVISLALWRGLDGCAIVLAETLTAVCLHRSAGSEIAGP